MAIDSSALELYGKPFYGIDALDDDIQFERMESFAGGEDDYRRSTLLDPDQCQRLVNIIVRDNYEAWTRPGADPLGAAVGTAAINSLTYFDTPANKFLLAAVNGALMSCSGPGQAWTATGFTTNAPGNPLEMEQGIETLLVSDGENAMATLDENLSLTTCTTDPTVDPPVGAKILRYHNGRMFAAGFAGATAGKERDAIWASNILSFGSGQWQGTTRSFRIGGGDGDPITALCPVQGSTLAVFKANSVWLVNTSAASDSGTSTWSATVVAESVGFSVGCVGKWAVAAYGNDVFFMAQDGVRSVQRMQAAAGQWQLTAPISQPVQQYIDRINPAAWQGICAQSYKEFVLFAVPLDSSTVNNAVLVYSARLAKWLGCWTGWTPTRFASPRFGNVGQLAFGDTNGLVNIWKDASDTNNPATYTDNGQNVPCTIATRSFQFNQPGNTKTAYNYTLRFTAGNAAATVTAFMDLAGTRSFNAPFEVAGDRLGQARLPFQLASVKPVKVQDSLRSLPEFQEMYLQIATTSGWIKLRNVTVTAFVNALDG
jgi:hypothetical protein